MYKNKSILMVMCARGGSKSVPKKNIRPLLGKPLIAHSIETALETGVADTVLVSTDSEEIQAVARKRGAETPFLRPAELANDTIGRIAAVIHAYQEAKRIYSRDYDIVVDLGVASPLRTKEDVIGVLDEFIENQDTDVVYTVTEASRNPYYNMVELDSLGVAKLSKDITPLPSCRQEAPKVYDMNDSVYAISGKALDKNPDITVPIQLIQKLTQRVYVMPVERSVDIDKEIDFTLTETLLKNEYSPR